MTIRRRILLSLCLIAGLLAVPRPATADVTGPPVLDAPVFNDPLAESGVPGTPSAGQSAILDQLIRLIRAAQPDSDIHFVWYAFANGQRSTEVAEQLVAAHQRGVHVKVILDSMEKLGTDAKPYNDPVTDTLRATLGTSESAASWVIRCEYPNEGAVDRGCIARDYMHSKFALFSRITVNGATHANVVFQTSSNLADWDMYSAFQDSYTFTDTAVYGAYRQYFSDLQAGRRKAVDPGYSWTTPTGTKHRATFFPRRATDPDPIVNVLKLIECGYDDNGVRRQTDIRLALTIFNKHRVAIANELLRLRGENCWVDVVFYENAANDDTKNVDATIRQVLNTTVNGRKIQVTPCRIPAGSRSVAMHSKVMMIDGYYDDDITPRVYMGSANFSHMENSDDSMVRIADGEVHKKYLDWFWHVRDTCAAG
ncbi:phosphatidylserine/phosphatidylglycerophosphate/cardiolipin synthase family protein [Nonomuraea sp. K274]|uniref:phospholipase D n=1 Tax=Nonomuraea cypriaca TaxID=1187855 RepID=A0A931F3X7_9ACTN|nr:phospholipase D-like domain-containing protein [Nonomuraea cypriaca]MBF8192082.1 phosphatidylserine/phosphatidylglycerophosphate/cardiolipin synthase family protein [Nonomuraea cypriaca]